MASTPLQLPGQLADLLNDLGFIWPKSDEVQMFELGGKWVEFGGESRGIHAKGQPHEQKVSQDNVGKDVEKFVEEWGKDESGNKVLNKGGTGAAMVGTGLFIAAGLVLALKIAVIVQLAILLAQVITALASAGPTFGASLAWIPVAKKLASMAINFLISQVVKALLG